MVEKQTKITEKKDVYVSGEESKVKDFFIGVGFYLLISAILGIFGGSFVFLMRAAFSSSNLITNLVFNLIGSLAMLIWVVPIITSLIIAKKYFPERRLVRVGAWVAFLLPVLLFLLLFGACLVAIGSGGFP